jgi:hypothetical protein
MHARRAGVAQLGHMVGNRAVASLLAATSSGAVQRELTPADIAAQSTFNPLDILHKLLNAIDQSDTTLTYTPGAVPTYGFNANFERNLKRHVDYPAVVRVLSDLTAAEAQAVRDAYWEHEKRSLETDLFAKGESGFDSDLTEVQRAHIRALLGGTAAARGASEEEQQAAATHMASAQAADLQRLLTGSLGKAEVERVMAILRQSAAANQAVVAAYKRLGGSLHFDLLRTGQHPRALLLLQGLAPEADSLKVNAARSRVQELDAEINKLTERLRPKELTIENFITGPSQIERMQTS